MYYLLFKKDVLVAPFRCVERFKDLHKDEVQDLFESVQLISKVVENHFGATSSTIAIQDGPDAGQTVKHVHVHILPRKENDFKRNDEVYDRLQDHDKETNMLMNLRSMKEMEEESAILRKYFESAK